LPCAGRDHYQRAGNGEILEEQRALGFVGEIAYQSIHFGKAIRERRFNRWFIPVRLFFRFVSTIFGHPIRLVTFVFYQMIKAYFLSNDKSNAMSVRTSGGSRRGAQLISASVSADEDLAFLRPGRMKICSEQRIRDLVVRHGLWRKRPRRHARHGERDTHRTAANDVGRCRYSHRHRRKPGFIGAADRGCTVSARPEII
jgi:hypothetical protein